MGLRPTDRLYALLHSLTVEEAVQWTTAIERACTYGELMDSPPRMPAVSMLAWNVLYGHIAGANVMTPAWGPPMEAWER
jgi:hypothetical protein